MAFTGNYMCTSFKQELLQAQHDFTASTGHTFKLALYDNNASFTASTTDYTATDEVSGTFSIQVDEILPSGTLQPAPATGDFLILGPNSYSTTTIVGT